jgi:hypothetical protein
LAKNAAFGDFNIDPRNARKNHLNISKGTQYCVLHSLFLSLFWDIFPQVTKLRPIWQTDLDQRMRHIKIKLQPGVSLN